MVIILESLKIENYKNIEKSNFKKFGDLNIIIGPNNVGKSNILKVICGLSKKESSSNILPKLACHKGGVQFRCNVCKKIKENLAKVQLGGIEYNITKRDWYKQSKPPMISYTFNKKLVISDFEKYYNRLLYELNKQHNLCGYLRSNNNLFTMDLIHEKGAGESIYGDHISILSIILDNQSILSKIANRILYCPELRLKEYKNTSISSYILNKSRTYKEVKELTDFIQRIIDSSLSSIIFPKYDKADQSLMLQFDGFDAFIDEQGSGLRSIICLAWDIIATEEKSIILIDEPELGLHPSAKHELLKLLLEQSENKQIFIATHDPTFVNPILWKECNGINVRVYLYSIINQDFVNVDLNQNKENPNVFAGCLPHTTSLKDIHIYLEGTSDVYTMQIWLQRYLKEKCNSSWIEQFNRVGVYHLSGSNWEHFLYTIPRKPSYKCIVILDGDKSKTKDGNKSAEEVCKKYEDSKFGNIQKFKYCKEIDEINNHFNNSKYTIVYCLHKDEIEYYLDPALVVIGMVEEEKLDNIQANIETIYELKDELSRVSRLKKISLNVYEHKKLKKFIMDINSLFIEFEPVLLVMDLNQKFVKITYNNETIVEIVESGNKLETKYIKIDDKVHYDPLIADKMKYVPNEIKKIFDIICHQLTTY